MARKGSIPLPDMVVQSVENRRVGVSRIIATKDGVTITIEKTGPLRDDLVPGPNDQIDVIISYDPKVPA